MLRAAFRRLLSLDDPPERTALAFAVGVFIAFSPFLGLHTILATFIAFLFRFNKIAIYTGTFVNNPFTLVPIIVAAYAFGALMLGRPVKIPPEGIEILRHPRVFSSDYYGQLFVHSWYLVEPFALGGMILSVICSLLAYPLTLWALHANLRRRQEQLRRT